MKSILCFMLVWLMCMCSACNSNSSKNINQIISFDKNFKYWLSDTLKLVRDYKVNGSEQKIYLSNDSSLLEIKKTYNVHLKINKKVTDKSLSFATELLRLNKELPSRNYGLQIVLVESYTPSFVEQQQYSYDYKYKRFIVVEDKIEKEYTFLKGNMISKRVYNRKSIKN